MKKDYIELRGVKARGFHGVYDEEKAEGQEFIVDVRLYLSLRIASETDNVLDTVNYADIATMIVETIQGPSVDLIETLAERIATRCLKFAAVDSVRVKVHKPQAPISATFTDTAVCIYRDRV